MHRLVPLVLLLVSGCGAHAGAQSRPPASEIRANITAVASEIHLIVFSAGKENGVEEGAEFQITRGGDVVGRGIVAKVDPRWSAGRILEGTAGDAVRIHASR